MKEARVNDEYRKNDLSLVPGGSEVKVKYSNDKIMIYDKVKNVKKYCSRMIGKNEVVQIWVDGQEYWKL